MDAVLIRRPRSGWPAALACVLALVSAHASRAADDRGLCAPSMLPPPPSADLEGSAIRADSARLGEDGISVVEGNVVLRTPDRTITADRMNYDADAGRAEASGRVTVREREVYLEGSRLYANLETGETVIEDATFHHPGSHGRGDAERIENDHRRTAITKGSFTTCDPGSRVWRLEAGSLVLDRESETGTARHARLRFFELPVLYTPWISFPIGDERKTGLLPPSFERSDSTGTSLTLPLYLNLAPNYDATLRPRLTSRRGGVLGGQFRYLTARGTGRLEAEALPEDRITGDARSLLSFRHRHRLAPGVEAQLRYARASDIDYLRDLGAGAPEAVTDYLPQFAELSYDVPSLRFEMQFEGFQSLRPAAASSDPYRVLPRLALESRLPEHNRGLHFDFRGEVSRFVHPSDRVASGTRLDLHPSVVLPLRSPSGYLLPQASLHYTQYELNDVAANVPDSPSRVVPSFSVDSGLYFDRHATLGGRRLVRTIEPRLFYLRVAHRDQDRLPLFDAGSLTSGYDHMFRVNRFSGMDRIGDADRLTLAVDTRLLEDGREIFAARLGTVRHFRDRRVRLCTTADPGPTPHRCPEGGTAGDRRPSTWVGALKARPNRSFTIAGSIEHDRTGPRRNRLSFDLRYHPSPERVVNFGYRMAPTETVSAGQVQESVGKVEEFLTASLHRDIGPRLRVLGSTSYAIVEDRLAEISAGFEYESCCWRLRALGQRYLTPGNGASEHESRFLLQFELKGLTGSGRSSDHWWTQPIPGYRNRF